MTQIPLLLIAASAVWPQDAFVDKPATPHLIPQAIYSLTEPYPVIPSVAPPAATPQWTATYAVPLAPVRPSIVHGGILPPPRSLSVISSRAMPVHLVPPRPTSEYPLSIANRAAFPIVPVEAIAAPPSCAAEYSSAVCPAVESQVCPHPPLAPTPANDRIHHLNEAVRHLTAAGLEQQAAELRRKIAELRRPEIRRQLARKQQQVDQLQKEIDQLQKQLTDNLSANLSAAAGAREILIQATIFEMSTDKLRALGVDFKDCDRIQKAAATDGEKNCAVIQSVKKAAHHQKFIESFAKTDALEVISRPQIRSLSGSPAEIHVGTEVPILIPVSGESEDGTISVEFREVGTKLHVVPTITEPGRIRIEMTPEMSWAIYASPDAAAVPDITMKRFHTQVELAGGESALVGFPSEPGKVMLFHVAPQVMPQSN